MTQYYQDPTLPLAFLAVCDLAFGFVAILVVAVFLAFATGAGLGAAAFGAIFF